MPNVNMASLRSSLRQCVEFCREHDDRDYCRRHRPILEEALDELLESRDETDAHYADWRDQRRSQLRAWKDVSGTLRETQRELDRVNAVGYPDKNIRYWDQELLEEEVENLIDYLRGRNDELEFADDYADKLERRLEKAHDELDDQRNALGAYRRRVKKRSDAMAEAAQVISDFRELLADELGEEHEEYEGIRWPYPLLPEQTAM